MKTKRGMNSQENPAHCGGIRPLLKFCYLYCNGCELLQTEYGKFSFFPLFIASRKNDSSALTLRKVLFLCDTDKEKNSVHFHFVTKIYYKGEKIDFNLYAKSE